LLHNKKTTKQAKDEMELLLRRDRAGCYVCMDEIFVFETTSFDIFCEKERWATAGGCTSCEFSSPTACESAWVHQPSKLKVISWFQSLGFQVQLVPLHHGALGAGARRGQQGRRPGCVHMVGLHKSCELSCDP
jgi:hypothetical protein